MGATLAMLFIFSLTLCDFFLVLLFEDLFDFFDFALLDLYRLDLDRLDLDLLDFYLLDLDLFDFDLFDFLDLERLFFVIDSGLLLAGDFFFKLLFTDFTTLFFTVSGLSSCCRTRFFNLG